MDILLIIILSMFSSIVAIVVIGCAKMASNNDKFDEEYMKQLKEVN